MSEQKHSTSDGAAGGTKPPLKKREKRKKPQEGGMEHLSSRIWKKQQPEGRALPTCLATPAPYPPPPPPPPYPLPPYPPPAAAAADDGVLFCARAVYALYECGARLAAQGSLSSSVVVLGQQQVRRNVASFLHTPVGTLCLPKVRTELAAAQGEYGAQLALEINKDACHCWLCCTSCSHHQHAHHHHRRRRRRRMRAERDEREAYEDYLAWKYERYGA